MTSETELEMQAIENTKVCNEGHRCPDGYSFWTCPFAHSKCYLVGIANWEDALAAKARKDVEDGEDTDG